jgi:REP element-mobilizing transposase RayT
MSTRDRQAVLTSGRIPGLVAEALRSSSSVVPVELLVWCLMPDHLHAVVVPFDGGNVIDWVRRLKGRVAAEARQEGLCALWQRSFYDHVLRADETVLEVARYVLLNPVRAELVDHWQEWPHHGSEKWDLSEWLDP